MYPTYLTGLYWLDTIYLPHITGLYRLDTIYLLNIADWASQTHHSSGSLLSQAVSAQTSARVPDKPFMEQTSSKPTLSNRYSMDAYIISADQISPSRRKFNAEDAEVEGIWKDKKSRQDENENQRRICLSSSFQLRFSFDVFDLFDKTGRRNLFLDS